LFADQSTPWSYSGQISTVKRQVRTENGIDFVHDCDRCFDELERAEQRRRPSIGNNPPIHDQLHRGKYVFAQTFCFIRLRDFADGSGE
jgi:hypothetical protein